VLEGNRGGRLVDLDRYAAYSFSFFFYETHIQMCANKPVCKMQDVFLLVNSLNFTELTLLMFSTVSWPAALCVLGILLGWCYG